MTILEFMAGWAVRSSILILTGSVLVRLVRVKNPAVRLTTWTALLAASLAIPALMTALPKLPIAVVRFPAPPPAAPALNAQAGAGFAAAGPALDPVSMALRRDAARPFDWGRIGAVVYATAAGALLLRLFGGLAMSLRILRRSRATGMVEDGIEIRESSQVASPVTVGLLRPVILLPPDWGSWDTEKLGAVLAHERSHVRRRDPAVQFVSAMHCALLWATPMSWSLHRRMVRVAEEVSDDDAVAATRDRLSYAEILLEFMQRGVGETNWVRVPMARYDRPETRIRRILDSTAAPRRVTRWAAAAILTLEVPLAYVAAAADPQSPQEHHLGPLPQFDVASVKPTGQGVSHMMGVHIYPGGRVEVFGANLRSLVATAFGVAYWQVSGGDDWTEKENFDIEAKPPEGLRSSIKSLRYSWYEIRDETLREMLQALLIRRFQLQVHRQTRTGDVYLLEQSGKPLRLHPVEMPGDENDATGNSGFESVGYAGGQWDVSNSEMTYLTKFAANYVLHVPVLDRTGLKGLYQYRQRMPDAEPKYGGDQSDSFLNFVAEMGLKLERTKGPVEVLAIDHASRPSAN